MGAWGSSERRSVTINKADDDEEPVAGIKFTIYRLFNSEVRDKQVDLITNGEGKFVIGALLYKTYYLEEQVDADTPKSYLRGSEGIEITTDITEVTVENKKAVADIEFIKHDENSEPFKNVIFTLLDEDNNSTGKEAVSREDGKVIFEGIEPGTYFIKETAPSGYEEIEIEAEVEVNDERTGMIVTLKYDDNEVTYTTSLAKSETAEGTTKKISYNVEYSDNERLTVTNKPMDVYGTVVLVKKGIDSSGKYANLDGAKFILAGKDVYDNDVRIESVESDEEGIVIFTEIPVGTYEIEETEAPKGYSKSDEKVNVAVSRNDADKGKADVKYTGENIEVIQLTIDEEGNGNETIMAAVINNEPINIEFIKTNTSGNPLQGAEFTLFGEDGEPVEGFDPVESNSFGEVIFTAVPEGSYIIKETKAPSGYRDYNKEIYVNVFVEDNEAVITFTIDSEVVELADGEMLTVENERRPGGGGDPTPVYGKIAIKKTDEDNRILSGAEFTLYDEDGKLVAGGVSGSDGTLSFDSLEYGTYVIKETKAPQGYIIIVDETEVVINSEAVKTFTFTNKKEEPVKPEIPDPETPVVPAYGRITINKVDENSMALAGAEFTLYNGNNEVLDTAASDESGRIVFENLEDGKYFVRETKAPEGYEIVTDALTVDVTEGKSYSYGFRNVPSDTEIEDPGIPKGWEKIDDPDVPVDTTVRPTLPDTGSLFNTWMLAVIGLIFILTGIGLYSKRRIRN